MLMQILHVKGYQKGEKTMEIKNKIDTAVENVDKIYEAAVDRTMVRINQTDENIDKDIETIKNAAVAAGETVETVAEAIIDRVVKVLNGEKGALKVTREDVISTIDKVVDKADAYYDIITNRIMERLEQAEGNVEKDIETAKQLKEDIK